MDDRDPAAGLCAQCAHCQQVRSARDSIFYRCRRAESDAAYARYPRLPVLDCTGFVRADRPIVKPVSAT
jgi:hypothetical protein